ncbi:MAG: glucosyl-3-phosphoglycerate synthase [Acidimicrobiia bacterium]
MPDDVSLEALLAAKAELGTTVSVCLPARNEEATVGQIVATVRRTLVQRGGLVDEVIVIDDGSTDATAEAATYDGARVVAVDDLTSQVGVGTGGGKGNAMWLSLYACEGDIICWVDADIRNFGEHFITRLLTPLLTDPAVGYVKGFYRRPLHGEATGGGRVTELMARPVISSLFPHLASFVQPLSGEYAGRRSLLESVPFVEGYGVEIGLLIDLVARYGSDALTQVDLGVREHRNRPLEQLAPQAMAVLVTGLRRAGVPIDRRLAELVRYDGDQQTERIPVEIRERPAMLTIPAYREKFGVDRALSA